MNNYCRAKFAALLNQRSPDFSMPKEIVVIRTGLEAIYTPVLTTSKPKSLISLFRRVQDTIEVYIRSLHRTLVHVLVESTQPRRAGAPQACMCAWIRSKTLVLHPPERPGTPPFFVL